MIANCSITGCAMRHEARGFCRTHYYRLRKWGNPEHELIQTRNNRSLVPEYGIWSGIKQRCYDQGYKRYKDYGGRGITVCERWLNNFDAFYADVGQRPSKDHSLDRINNDGNYEPGNVKWSTRTEQQNNKRTNLLVTHRGETHTVAEWSRMTGIHWSVIRERIVKLGWSTERALTTPVQPSPRSHQTSRP